MPQIFAQGLADVKNIEFCGKPLVHPVIAQMPKLVVGIIKELSLEGVWDNWPFLLVQLVWLGIYDAIMLDEWKLGLIILTEVGICLKDFQNSRASCIAMVGVLELGKEAWVNLDD